MKSRHYFLIFFSIILSSVSCYAQDLFGLNPESLKTAQDYKNAEERVLSCANYLLNNPIDKEDLIRKTTFTYLFKWVEGTPEHTFSLDEEVVLLTGNDKDILTIYFSALAKTVLEEPSEQSTDEEIQEQAIQYLLDYCSDPENHLKPTKRMNKMSKKNKT